jgi:hypothetical protein
MGLLLEAVDVASAWRWRWILRDSSTGEMIAGHPVALDPESDEPTAFGNLGADADSAAMRSPPGRRRRCRAGADR